MTIQVGLTTCTVGCSSDPFVGTGCPYVRLYCENTKGCENIVARNLLLFKTWEFHCIPCFSLLKVKDEFLPCENIGPLLESHVPAFIILTFDYTDTFPIDYGKPSWARVPPEKATCCWPQPHRQHLRPRRRSRIYYLYPSCESEHLTRTMLLTI